MVRRPLLFAITGQAAGIALGYYFSRSMLLVFVLSAAGLLFIMQRQCKSQLARIVSLAGAGFILGSFCFSAADLALKEQAEEFAGRTSVTGKVTDTEFRISQNGDEYIQLTVKSEKGKVIVKCYEGSFEETPIPGYTVNAQGKVEMPPGQRNPGCFNYCLYLKSLGVTGLMSGKKIEITDCQRTLFGELFLIKDAFSDRIESTCGKETAAMIKAIMFGDKGELDSDVVEVFQRNGTAHILAVSGLHIGIIYGVLLKIWPGRKGRMFFCFMGFFFFCYAVMAGFSPSVVRAVIMVMLHAFATVTGRKYDLNNAAFAVASAVLLLRPFMLFNTGFQMSFLAVLTMSLALPYIKSFYSGAAAAGIAVQLGLGPFIWYNFNYISLLAVIINVPVVFLAGIVVPAGLAGLVLMRTVLFEPAARIVELVCSVLKELNELAEIPGVTTFQLPSPPVWAVAAFYLGLIVFASEEGRLAVLRASNKKKHAAGCALIVIAAALLFSSLSASGFGKCSLTFVDVGQGDCIYVDTGKGKYLFDGGGSENYNVGKSTLRPYLLKNGTGKVDGAFVTHLHTDHYKGICELAREGMVKKLYVYEANSLREEEIVKETGLEPENIVYLHAGQNVKLGRNYSVSILWPDKKTAAEYSGLLANEDDENSMSLVMRINAGGTSVLVTGDIDSSGEDILISERKDMLRADILKVAHHGSKYSTSKEFLEAVSPETSVIQVGKNNYGHPSREVLSRLEEKGITIYRNDDEGAIGVEIKAGRINIITGEDSNTKTCVSECAN